MIRAKAALATAGALVLAGALAAGVAHAAGPTDPPAAGHQPASTWVGSWATVPTTVPPASDTVFSNQTIRQTMHLSLGGSTLRVRFSNEFGTAPLVIGEAHVGRAARDRAEHGRSRRARDRRVTFAGHVSAAVPAGAPLVSDPVRLRDAGRRRPRGQPLPAAAGPGRRPLHGVRLPGQRDRRRQRDRRPVR